MEWFKTVAEEALFVSVVTLAELSRGIEKARIINPAQAARLDVWFAHIGLRFDGKTFDTDGAVWDAWAGICGKLDAIGQPPPPIDTLLVATAQLHKLTIVTRNVRDFAPYPLIFNPWIESVA
jgi:toxin FitB